jgi:sugar phosphate isomerase/epimerase
MNKRMVLGMILVVAALCLGAMGTQSAQAEEGWRLGMQAYSFNRFTFYEAVDKTRALGMEYIEAYPGQRLSDKHGDARFHHDMSPELRQEVKQMLRDKGVKLINYGVVGLPNNEAECRKVFDFARDMGIETIVSEPPENAIGLIDRLCQEYKIYVALHNHPEPSFYWNPDTVLRLVEGRSKWIGACADTGHWTRSGVDPVEAVRKLEGRIISFHFKDLTEFGNKRAHDVPWGTGKSKAREVLEETGPPGLQGQLLRRVRAQLAQLDAGDRQVRRVLRPDRLRAGVNKWQRIFNGSDLTGWDGDPRLWSVRDGAIRGETTPENPTKGNTFLVYRGGVLGDFELKLQFRIQNGNSGVQYRSKEFDKWRIGGYQAEVEDTPGKVGFLYHEAGRGWLTNVGDFMVIDEKGEKKVISNVNDQKALIEAGYYRKQDWNEYHIVCEGNHIKQFLNGYKTVELIDNDRQVNPFDPRDRRGSARSGVLALQIHSGPPMVVEFRDIRIKQLAGEVCDAVPVFNGQNLDEWTTNAGSGKENLWAVGKARLSASNPRLLEKVEGTGEMINLAAKNGDSQDIYSKAKFGDCRIEVEVMVPRGSNSGIYVMGEYEVQVLDSYGRTKMGSGDMGAIYGGHAPPVNASKKPGEWQQYVIEWRAPQFDGTGNKTRNAEFVKVELNGQVLHKNLIMPGPTPGGVTGKEAPMGPLMFQGNHGPVAYRNIVVKPLLK